MSDFIACPAPAKINLFLHVVGRRDDGYHLLQSAFRLLDWCDVVRLRVRDDGLIRRLTDVPGVPAETDLTVRAAHLLRLRGEASAGVDIEIDKHLPMGGGLGGGSSDAASVLVALNRLWGIGLDRTSLMELGLQLGADIPFFVFGRDAFVEGIGERVQALDLPPAHYVVLSPRVEVPTGAIFSASELTRNSTPIKMPDFAASATRNDLEAVVRLRYPQVDQSIRWLEQYSPARMTGSGACVFAQFPDEQSAQRVAASCPQQWQAWSVKSLRQHPLSEWLRD